MAGTSQFTRDELEEIFAHASVGIDLGTTYSAVAVISDTGGVPDVLTNSDGSLTTPSVVLFDEDGATIVGEEAKNVGQGQSDRVIECVKRFMGNPETKYEIDGKEFTPEGISAIILGKLIRDASERLGRQVKSAAVTVPAWFNDDARQATARAGKAAGLHVLGILSEPTAAALAYGMGDRQDQIKGKTALVYDLGGGTFDVSIIKVGDDGSVEELARDGEVFLGGKDWDQRIVDQTSQAFEAEFGHPLPEDSDAYMSLSIEAERAKMRLSKSSKARVFTQHEGDKLTFNVTRDDFDAWTTDLLSRTEDTVNVTLDKASLSAGDIDICLPVGGATRMPQVQNLLGTVFPGKVDDSVEKDLVVAMGASLYMTKRLMELKDELKETLMAGEGGAEGEDEAVPMDEAAADGFVQEIVDQGESPLKDVNPAIEAALPTIQIVARSSRTYGIVALRKDDGSEFNDHFVEANDKLPVTRDKTYATMVPNQPSVLIQLLEGDSEDVDACEQKKEQEFPLPPNLPKDTPLPCKFHFTDDQGITITITDPKGEEHVFKYGDAEISDKEKEAVGKALVALDE